MSHRHCSTVNALLAAASLFAIVVLTAPASAQDANALATIEETRAGGQKACATGKKFTIAFSHSISEAAIVKAVRRFADMRAAELGCVTMLHDKTQANNLEQQIDAVQSWVTQGVDAIIVTPIDERALKPLQVQAQKKGIKWLTYLGQMDQSDGYVSFSHSQSGQIVANAAVKWVKDNQIKDPIALVTTLNGLPSLSPRWTEVERIFAANGIRIVAKNDQESADQASGLKAAETALKQHPNLSIVIGLNDESALGALQAVERAGIAPNKIFVAGQDGLQEGLAAVNEGGAYKASAAILINELGANIVDQALNAIAGTGPTVVETPTVLASKSDQTLLDKLIKNYQR
jgi:ABC-type sugar transport system substrate-binding protein